jgi:hypothetical protein
MARIAGADRPETAPTVRKSLLSEADASA